MKRNAQQRGGFRSFDRFPLSCCKNRSWRGLSLTRRIAALRLVAMMPAAQSQSVLVGERCEIVWMCCIHYKPNKCAALFGWTENTHSGQFRETFGCIASKVRVVFKNCCASDLLDVLDRCREADRAGDVRCASLKSVWRFFKCALFQGDAHDHLPATVPWRHRIEDLTPSVERADAGRPTHFVSGEGEEIAS